MPNRSKRVLIVDDDHAIRQLLRRILRTEYQLAEATGGRQALEILASFLPDLVTLDLRMPDIDGWTTCRRLRSNRWGRKASIVVISADCTREDQRRAYEAGADDFVVKPFCPEEVRSRVRLHLQLREILDTIGPTDM